MSSLVLFVDDDKNVLEAIFRRLKNEPYALIGANCAQEALSILSKHSVDIVVSDEQMPGMSGLEFLRLVKEHYPDVVRMILTGNLSVELALEAINKNEVYRLFQKPCNDVEMALSIREALEQKELLLHAKRLIRLLERQSAYIRELEQEIPGIGNFHGNEEGQILFPDNEIDSLEEALKEATATFERVENKLR